MVQMWKCVNCGHATWDPTAAGDHERDRHGRILLDPEYNDWGIPLHFMEDVDE